jgi:16S rRNA processing protein RimM
MQDFLQVGKVVNTHGVKGEVKVVPLTDDPQRYDKLKWVYAGNDDTKQILNIESVKYFKNTVIIKFKEVPDMDGAINLKEQYLYVDRKNAVKLPKDTYFICDLIGSEVFETDGTKLGDLRDIIQTGSNDVYIVKSESGKEILVPALKSVVKEISIENKKIVVELPEGLIEDEI